MKSVPGEIIMPAVLLRVGNEKIILILKMDAIWDLSGRKKRKPKKPPMKGNENRAREGAGGQTSCRGKQSGPRQNALRCDYRLQLARRAGQYLELHAGGHHDGPEGERVRADGRDHDGGDVGVDHGGSGRHRVGRAPRRRGHDQPCRGRETGTEAELASEGDRNK